MTAGLRCARDVPERAHEGREHEAEGERHRQGVVGRARGSPVQQSGHRDRRSHEHEDRRSYGLRDRGAQEVVSDCAAKQARPRGRIRAVLRHVARRRHDR